jgi:hypothetical protein
MVTPADGAQRQTLDAAWQSSDRTVATISPTGLLTLVGFGDADVTVTFENLPGFREEPQRPLNLCRCANSPSAVRAAGLHRLARLQESMQRRGAVVWCTT